MDMVDYIIANQMMKDWNAGKRPPAGCGLLSLLLLLVLILIVLAI